MSSPPDLPTPILTLKNSIVRPYHPSDAPSLAQAADSQAVARFLRNTFPQPYTLAAAEAWIAMNQAAPVRNWLIACPSTGRAMGSIGLVPGRDVYARSFELGYWIGEEFWGRGVMGELVPAFAVWVLKGLGDEGVEVERLWAGVFSENAASQRVLERSGFRLEGRMRRAVVKDGVVMDDLIYSIVKGDSTLS